MRSPIPEISSKETSDNPTRIPHIAAKPALTPPLMENLNKRKVSAPGDRMMNSEDRIKGSKTLGSTTDVLSQPGTV
jgi:hypothetical protein